MSKRPTIRKTPLPKGAAHQTPSPNNGIERGDLERARMRSELVPREKPATTIKATMTKRSAAEHDRFGILIIEPRPQLSFSLQRDIHFLEFPHTALHRVRSLPQARTLLAKEQIELVIVSLNLPSDALTDFFRAYPSHSRPFALILTETPEQSMTETPTTTTYWHYLRSTNCVAEEQASGYLLLGISSNQHLAESLERARRWVQEYLVREYQDKVIASLDDYFRHPAIAARQRLADNAAAQGKHHSIDVALGELLLNKKKYARQPVPFDKIVYLQGAGKYVYVWYFSDESELKVLHLLKRDVLPQIPTFILNVHTSYWVNTAYIRELGDTDVTLLTNDRIPIARRERKAVANIFQQMHPESFALPILKNVISRSTTQRMSLEDITEQKK